MDKYIRVLCLLLCLLFSVIILSGCYDNIEIEDLAYVVAIGIDEAEANNFILTFQTAVPQSIAGGGGEGTDITSFKTDNFLTGLKKTSEYLSRKINMSHTKIIVVSEAIAKKGVLGFLNGLQEILELRPNVNIVVSEDGAKKYIESVQPKLSANPAKYYELLFNSYETEFRVPYTQLEDFMYRAKSNSLQPITVFTGVNTDIIESKKPSAEEGKKKEGSGSKSGAGGGGEAAGEEPKKSMSIKGLTVFNADKMVGKLEPNEATLYALMNGANKNMRIEVTDPLDNRFKVLCRVAKEKSSYTKIYIEDNKPRINIYLKLTAEIIAVQSDNDYDEPNKAPILKEAYETYLKNDITKLLTKVTKQYKSDIFSFSELAKRNYKTIDEWNNVGWPKIFPQSDYNLIIDFEIIKKD